jgi:imidazolonepropionase
MTFTMGNIAFPQQIDSLWLDCRAATMAGGDPYGIIDKATIAVIDGKIAWIGPQQQIPAQAAERAKKVYRLNGAWITPGLIDCHTHLVYAGSRAREFEMRINGATYEEIAIAGGGIMSTVNAVRAATHEELFVASANRLKAFQEEGVTTVEIKSGYGLDTANERKMLEVIRRLSQRFEVTVSPTFLGAHTLPPEYKGRSDAYVDLVIEEMLPSFASKKLMNAVDIFCERIAFNPAQVERIFKAATKQGLNVKLHAEQLSNQNGAILAAKYNALSADHLEYITPEGIAAMADAGMVAVLLPGAFYFLKETRKPPIEQFRQAGIPMAISTDCNPGSSPTTSPLLMMNLACILFDMTPAEALAGFTIHAATALGMKNKVGSLEVGKKADFAVWEISEPAELAYNIGGRFCRSVVKQGSIVF